MDGNYNNFSLEMWTPYWLQKCKYHKLYFFTRFYYVIWIFSWVFMCLCNLEFETVLKEQAVHLFFSFNSSVFELSLETVSATTSWKTKIHVLTKGFHESECAQWFPVAEEMLGGHHRQKRNPEAKICSGGRTQILNNFIMFYFVLYQFARMSFL